MVLVGLVVLASKMFVGVILWLVSEFQQVNGCLTGVQQVCTLVWLLRLCVCSGFD